MISRRTLLAGTAATALTAAAGTAANARPATTTRPAWAAPFATADGFAGTDLLGQNGTTGGVGGPVVTVRDTEAFLDYCDRNEPYVIQVDGIMRFSSKRALRSNKTVIGLPGAEINGGGLDVYRRQNVIIRNLRFTGADDDAISIQQSSHHIWIDHCDLGNGADGLVDIVRGADLVTVSWCHFHDHSKTALLGHSDSNAGPDTGRLRTTFHHNYFDGTAQRHPRVRFGEPIHVYNNYFRDNALYGVASTENAGVLVEHNHFQNVAHPIYSGYDESGPGRVVERDNVYVGSGAPQTLGTVVEPRTYYAYTPDNASSVPSLVTAGAGVGRI
ncbi:pectate lyase family protein [Saccharothrix syringae]|uniref:pectate lyase family protein n=1 Tax=Saccharothrix syringae TaxID=103733 RepID=UPI0005258B3B|nr:right-handed parallel beta-helix repeat-containing protein [Saccharothrix syringae]